MKTKSMLISSTHCLQLMSCGAALPLDFGVFQRTHTSKCRKNHQIQATELTSVRAAFSAFGVLITAE